MLLSYVAFKSIFKSYGGFPDSHLLVGATNNERGDAFTCHGHDFGQFIFFLFLHVVLTMLKHAFLIIESTFWKLCIYHSLVGSTYHSAQHNYILYHQFYWVRRASTSSRRICSGAYELSLIKWNKHTWKKPNVVFVVWKKAIKIRYKQAKNTCLNMYISTLLYRLIKNFVISFANHSVLKETTCY